MIYSMQRDGQLYNAQIRRQVAACLAQGANQKFPDFFCQLRQGFQRNFSDITRFLIFSNITINPYFFREAI